MLGKEIITNNTGTSGILGLNNLYACPLVVLTVANSKKSSLFTETDPKTIR